LNSFELELLLVSRQCLTSMLVLHSRLHNAVFQICTVLLRNMILIFLALKADGQNHASLLYNLFRFEQTSALYRISENI
jgi:hypothetical protein